MVLGIILCDLDPKVKVIYFFSCKCISSLTAGHSNFKVCRCIGDMVYRVLGNILCNLGPKVKVIGKKADICDGGPLTAAIVFLYNKNYFDVGKTVYFLSN